MELNIYCSCRCSFKIESLRLQLADPLKCPNCLKEFRGKEDLFDAIKLLEQVRDVNNGVMAYKIVWQD